MLLTITTTRRPASDLGFLLHKHPGKAQSFAVASGVAHVFYPRADEDGCTVALLLEVDPIALVRGRAGSLTQYVNDRPYAAGSLLAVAMGAVFRTAMNGRCDARPELAARAIPLRIEVPALGTPDVGAAAALFGPLGWAVDVTPVPLDPEVPAWGDSRYVDLVLTAELRLADALKQLYVLLPVLDGSKHYWIDQQEVDKLLRAGEGWLAGHPERELITRRYLGRGGRFAPSALERLAEADDVPEEELDNALDEPVDVPLPLAVQRRETVLAVLRSAGARRVVDLGCGEGALLRELVEDPSFTEVLGVDVSSKALSTAERRLHLDRLSDRARERISVRQSSLTYADAGLAGYDAAVLMEVVEHVEEDRLPVVEHNVFGVARPGTVVVTTPNVEYNALFESLRPNTFRHTDHRFEWTRARFRAWADGVGERYGYTAAHLPVGPEDPALGSPTQLAVFTRKQEARWS
ncbi:3' terminal RNA ribose 2'-O-methyltransferase Hen1 [Umezawaea sp. Da 62-37]|uniref:3' terminal RNA ribose 2'-O-methyltransferase Hen1 n=1 Tax=Umezawaea sp. Da 62-37 TaxID=3075927 RepID=UPI0028F721D8|nr:3' terminal RNA ribose 2'-O-methyltransferase Hen1 [Umezawaea sp. Da 62-37]WNV82338.1 3' terminal RNA ribose 2'-O-methyltransferase Hen1 [Umezawaea sp. Da 62-37]